VAVDGAATAPASAAAATTRPVTMKDAVWMPARFCAASSEALRCGHDGNTSVSAIASSTDPALLVMSTELLTPRASAGRVVVVREPDFAGFELLVSALERGIGASLQSCDQPMTCRTKAWMAAGRGPVHGFPMNDRRGFRPASVCTLW